jgi:hypothetical protein
MSRGQYKYKDLMTIRHFCETSVTVNTLAIRSKTISGYGMRKTLYDQDSPEKMRKFIGGN